MHNTEQIADHFGLVRENNEAVAALSDEKRNMLEMMGMGTFVAENYFIWGPSAGGRVPRNRLMTKPALEHWLYSHLLKICLPYSRPTLSDRPVMAPLNLTAFFRLVARMHEVGYPAHWLSSILATVCEGSITTTARAPRRIVLLTDDPSKLHPARKITLRPWTAEYTTLLSLWRRILPFGIMPPKQSLVQLKEIIQCSITFPDFDRRGGRSQQFILVFWNTEALGHGSLEFPQLIQDDEQGDISTTASRFRDTGIHIITTWKYVTNTGTASFWMRQDLIIELLQGRAWKVGICRTNEWHLLPDTVAFAGEVLKTLGSWSQI